MAQISRENNVSAMRFVVARFNGDSGSFKVIFIGVSERQRE